ncbi:hypothetical protein ONZ45_g15421 [Pleurotus djamor]|nr:hypothetical protein ONZ45_g15421 [Pleurotus djamor]
MLSTLLTPQLLIALLLGAVAFRLAKYLAHILTSHSTLRRVPGPSSPSLLWGVEWLLYHDVPGVHYVDWHAQFGKVIKLSGAFGHPILSITDRRAISFILNEATYKFPKPHGVRAWFKALVGEGILWIEGKEHHEKHRRHIAPALSQQSIRKFLCVFYETSSMVASHWSKKLDQTPHDQVEIDVTHWAGRFALDTIGRAAFSFDFDSLNDQPHVLADALDGLTNNENRLSSFYMRALFWIFPSILKIGKKGELIKQTKAELGEIAAKLLTQAQAADDPESNTLLAMMLRSPAGVEMTEEYLVSQMRTIISAAYETVSAVIAWVLYELAVHPDIQQRLREEVTFPGDPTYEDLMNKFPLLDAILRETLRVHPVVLENHHVAQETIPIPLSEPLLGTDVDRLVVPKGTIISIPVNVLHTDKNIWGPDAQVFYPGRWLERPSEKIKMQRDILAFSEGPRSCIGKTFAPSVSRDVRVVWVQNGGTLAHTTADFYQSQYFLCAGLEDEWVGELMLKSRIAFHFDWVLQSVEQNCLAPVARFVLDDLFDEDDLRVSTNIPHKVSVSSVEEVPKQQESKQTKKRTRDELDTSVSDINLHLSKRTRPNNTTPSMRREPPLKVDLPSSPATSDAGKPGADSQVSEPLPILLLDEDHQYVYLLSVIIVF